MMRTMKQIANVLMSAAFMLLACYGCAPVDPGNAELHDGEPRQMNPWRLRAYQIVDMEWPNIERIDGMIAVEIVRATSDFGPNAGLSDDEKRAIVRELRQGRADAIRERQ